MAYDKRAPSHLTPENGIPTLPSHDNKIADVFYSNPLKFAAVGLGSSALGYVVGYAAPAPMVSWRSRQALVMAPMFAAFILAGYVTGEHKHIIFERNREKGETQYRIALREAKETGRVNV